VREVRKTKEGFYVFVNGIKDESIDCDECVYYKNGEKDGFCSMSKTKDGKYRCDDKLYLFCGKVCGYWSIGEKSKEGLVR